MARSDLTAAADGSILRTLASGLEIVRRKKHEPIAFGNLTAAELARMTDKRNGSKCLPRWTLPFLVDWIETQVRDLPAGHPMLLKVRLDQPVGYSDGTKVYTTAIRCDGRYVHAYPEKDE